MPEKKTVERARQAKRQGKAPSTQAGEFVQEEMDHVRQGKHGVSSPKQAIAIGLSKARRAGVDLKPPAKGKASTVTRKKAERDYTKGHRKTTAKRTAAKHTSARHTSAKRVAAKHAPAKRAPAKAVKHARAKHAPARVRVKHTTAKHAPRKAVKHARAKHAPAKVSAKRTASRRRAAKKQPRAAATQWVITESVAVPRRRARTTRRTRSTPRAVSTGRRRSAATRSRSR